MLDRRFCQNRSLAFAASRVKLCRAVEGPWPCSVCKNALNPRSLKIWKSESSFSRSTTRRDRESGLDRRVEFVALSLCQSADNKRAVLWMTNEQPRISCLMRLPNTYKYARIRGVFCKVCSSRCWLVTILLANLCVW